MRLTAGTHARLGANWDGRGANFALLSANATKVELCLFDSQGKRVFDFATGADTRVWLRSVLAFVGRT